MPSAKAIWTYWEPRLREEMPSVHGLLREWRQMGDPKKEPWDTCWSCADDDRKIERAHLHARCYAGLDHVGNLVLLCDLCHRQQPDFGAADAKRWLDRRAYTANYGCDLFGTLPILLTTPAADLVDRGLARLMVTNVQMSAEFFGMTQEDQDRLRADAIALFTDSKRRVERAWNDYNSTLGAA